MRNTLISILSTLLLLLLALAIIPVFVSTGFLKTQVQQFVKEQANMSLDIQGDVSLSLLTGLKLSAEDVSLRDAEEKPLIAIDRLDFSLALAPLLSGKADITGITLNKPVLTLNAGSNQAEEDIPVATEGPHHEAETDQPTDNVGKDIDLSALSLRRLTIKSAQLIRVDGGGHSTSLVSGLDATLSVPDFNGPAELSASLPFKDQDIQLSGQLSNVSEAINGRVSRLDLDVTNDLIKARMEGDLTLKGVPILVANFAANAGNITQLANWLGMPSPSLSIGKAMLEGSIIADASLVRLTSLKLALDDQTISAAAKAYIDPSLERPFVRLAIDGSTLDLDTLLAQNAAASLQKTETGSATISDTNAETDSADNTPPDLSILSTFDATLDMRIGRATYQGKAIRQIKLISRLIDGALVAELKSANLAKGNIQARIDGNLQELLWNGSLIVHELDIGEAAKLANQNSPLSGMLSSRINFALQGVSGKQWAQNGNIAGTVTLEGGTISHPALQEAIPNRESGTISNISSQITIKGLEQPADISGAFTWNGEAIRYASTIGLAQALAGTSIPVSLSLDTQPVALGLSGLINPAALSLSGSELSLRSPSSRALLAWLGQPVTSGTPDQPLSITTNLAFAPEETILDNLSLQMGQSKGNGKITYKAGTKPAINGQLAFDKLDFTPFLGNGTEQGRSAQQSSRSSNRASASAKNDSGWDTGPIDFSSLNQANATLAFSAKSLIARDIVTGPVAMQIALQDGKLTTTLQQLSLYSGKGTGTITIDARTNPAQMAAQFSLSQMQMAGFLSDTIGLKSLSGRGSIALNLTTSGASQAQLISQLNGTSNLDIRDGQIHGINIPQMLRRLKGNILDGWASSETQSTDFSALTASFQINNGMVRNADLLMLSPLLRLSGAGTIDLPNMRIDYKATPKLIAKLTGQGGLVDADGVPIPIIIKGKLTKPRIYPDIPGILENPQAILQSLEQMGDVGKATSKGVQKLEKNVTKELQKQSDKLGIDLNQLIKPKNSNQEDNQTQQKPAKQLLNNITKGLFGN